SGGRHDRQPARYFRTARGVMEEIIIEPGDKTGIGVRRELGNGQRWRAGQAGIKDRPGLQALEPGPGRRPGPALSVPESKPTQPEMRQVNERHAEPPFVGWALKRQAFPRVRRIKANECLNVGVRS